MSDRQQPIPRISICWLLMLLSGAAGLAYEICWIRMFALGLGHEMPATAAVISAFFGGLSIGAWILDQPIRRSSSPAVWYAALELLIAGWAVATATLIPWLNDQVGVLTGATPTAVRHWSVAFLVPLITLAPASVAMGATLPAMDRIVESWQGTGRWIGGIYAANTFGAVIGTFAATFFLLPTFGFTLTLAATALLSLCCAVAAYGYLNRPHVTSREPPPRLSSTARPQRLLLLLLFTTGLLGIGYEILGTRVMGQVQENTVYSFASVLSVYLLGTSLGAMAYQRWLSTRNQFAWLSTAIGLLAVCCLIGLLILSRVASIHSAALMTLGPGLWSAVTTEATLAVLVFGAPAFCMGLTFSLLAQMWRDRHVSVGKAIATNTLGATFAAPLFAPLVLPALGAKWSLICVCAGYLVLLLMVRFDLRRGSVSELGVCQKGRSRMPVEFSRFSSTYVFSSVGILLVVLAAGQDLRFVEPMAGGKVLDYRDGVMAAVAVVTDSDGERFLKVNDRFRMGGTTDFTNERRLAHIPLLLHPHPQQSLFLGLGTGNTLAAVADHPGLHAEAVELVPEIVDFQPYFAAATGDLSANKAIAIHVSDARRFIRSTDKQYDVIVADLFHPARDGSGALYTREHFRAIRHRLATNGLFCQWLPLYQMDESCLRIILQTFLEVFPQATAYLSTLDVHMPILGLIGCTEPTIYDALWFDRRVGQSPLRQAVIQSGITDPLALFGLKVAAAHQLQAFANDAPINTDDHLRITFLAPKFIYSHQRPAYELLQAILDATSAEVDSINEGAFAVRVAKYASARDCFLRAEIQRADGNLNAALEGYVKSSELSADFHLGYLVSVMRAQQLLAENQAADAVRLLKRLIHANPSRPEAKLLLRSVQP